MFSILQTTQFPAYTCHVVSDNKYWGCGVATHRQFGESGTDSLSAKGILLELQQLQGDSRQSLARRSVHQHILTGTHTRKLCQYTVIYHCSDIIKSLLINLTGILLLQTIVFSSFKPGLLFNVPCQDSFLCMIIIIYFYLILFLFLKSN